MLNKTKIICGIGPSSDNERVLEQMINNGMNIARLNLSYEPLSGQQKYIDLIRKLSLIHDKPVSIILDTYGPKIKTDCFEKGQVLLAKGSKVLVHTNNEILGNSKEFSINCSNLFDDIEIEKTILLNGVVTLLVINKLDDKKVLECEVLNSGTIIDNSLVNVPNIKSSLPFISHDDASVLKFACKSNVDLLALSFVRKASDVIEVKDYLKNENSNLLVLSKIENKEACDNFDEILKVSDGIIIPRGDLSIEIPFEELTLITKKMIQKANKAGKPVIVGTQVLSSMTRNKKPSRAEVSDVTNLVLDGVDGIALTNVTANGFSPENAVNELKEIIKVSESSSYELNRAKLMYNEIFDESNNSFDDAVASAVIVTANKINAKLIVAFSESGATAKRISKYRPNCPIASVSSDESIRMGLTLNWGIYPVVASHKTYEIDFMSLGSEIAVYYGLKEGDTFIITGGNGIGNTNLMRVCKL